MDPQQTTIFTQKDKDAQYARDYYHRNRDAVLARMKAKRDQAKKQNQENKKGRGRPRTRVDVPKKEKSQPASVA